MSKAIPLVRAGGFKLNLPDSAPRQKKIPLVRAGGFKQIHRLQNTGTV